MKLSKLSLTSMFKSKQTYDWRLSNNSKSKLDGVNPDLIKVVELALKYSKYDFGITCGLRSKEEQEKLLAEGKTQTLKSRHLTGNAVDIVVYIDGKMSWDIKDYVVVAQAFAEAARELNVPLRWGGAWTHPLSLHDAQEAHDSYVELRKSQGKKVFIDGPHFEIP